MRCLKSFHHSEVYALSNDFTRFIWTAVGIKQLKLQVKLISKPIFVPFMYNKTQPNENVRIACLKWWWQNKKGLLMVWRHSDGVSFVTSLLFCDGFVQLLL